MANYKHDNTFIFKNKNINVSVHPFIEEHLKSLKKTFPNYLFQTQSFLSSYANSEEQLRPVTLFGAESVVQSVNAEGGPNQRLRPISGQACLLSKMTSSLVRKGQAKRKTIHFQHNGTPCREKTTVETSGHSSNNDVILQTCGYQEACVKKTNSVVAF